VAVSDAATTRPSNDSAEAIRAGRGASSLDDGQDQAGPVGGVVEEAVDRRLMLVVALGADVAASVAVAPEAHADRARVGESRAAQAAVLVGPARAGIPVTLWADTTVVHLLVDGEWVRGCRGPGRSPRPAVHSAARAH
jgi:hypothetical protein